MTFRMDELSHKHWEYIVTALSILFLFVFTVIFIDIAGIYNIFTIPTPPYKIPEIIGGIGAGASVMVSILLLYVYDKQREIISEQKNLTEYQQTSLLRVEDHKIIDYQESKKYQEQNYFSSGNYDNLFLYQTEYMEVDLLNVGLAPAHDLRVDLYIETEDGSYTADLPLVAGTWQEVISELYSHNKSSIFF